MTILSLTEVALVDKGGLDVRLAEDLAAGIPVGGPFPPEEGAKFMDLGIVDFGGIQYYASVYWPPIGVDDAAD